MHERHACTHLAGRSLACMAVLTAGSMLCCSFSLLLGRLSCLVIIAVVFVFSKQIEDRCFALSFLPAPTIQGA